jgi:hypothetical protein
MDVKTNFLKSIKNSSHTSDLLDKLGEVALDSTLREGIVKDIPIIGTAFTLWKAGNDIAAHFFAKKVSAFLTEIDKVPHKKRVEFAESHLKNESQEENVGEVTLMLLEKMDHPLLAKLLGRAFALMVEEKISPPTFEFYSYIIRNLNPYLIQQIRQLYCSPTVQAYDVVAAIMLSNYGLAEVNISPSYSETTKQMTKTYDRTQLGAVFFENILKE